MRHGAFLGTPGVAASSMSSSPEGLSCRRKQSLQVGFLAPSRGSRICRVRGENERSFENAVSRRALTALCGERAGGTSHEQMRLWWLARAASIFEEISLNLYLSNLYPTRNIFSPLMGADPSRKQRIHRRAGRKLLRILRFAFYSPILNRMKSQFCPSNCLAEKNRFGPRFPKTLPGIHKSVASSIALAFSNQLSRKEEKKHLGHD